MKPHPDFEDFVRLLNEERVDYVVIDAFALAFHGHPRYTGDFDVWLKPTEDNAARLSRALRRFSAPLEVSADDLLSGKIVQLGVEPVRIDLVSLIDGVSTEEIWASRINGNFGDVPVPFIGREAFLKNKRASGRPQDLADIEALGEVSDQK